MTSSNLLRTISPVVQVRWAGWRATTLSLQNAGWQISAEERIEHNSIRLAIHHPAFHTYGISKEIPYSWLSKQIYPVYEEDFPFDIRYLTSDLRVQIMDDLSKFQPVDAEPQIIEAKNIEDFKMFRQIGNMPEVAVEPASVPEMLEMILKYQSPKQAEIREKRRKEMRKIQEGMTIEGKLEYNPAADYIAQIVAIR